MFVKFEVLNTDEGKIHSLVHIAVSYGESKTENIYIYANETFRTKTADSGQRAVLYKQLVSFLHLTATVQLGLRLPTATVGSLWLK